MTVPKELVDERRWAALSASLADDGEADGVPSVLADVVGRYGATTAQRLAAARSAVRAGRPAEATAVLHTLRGSSAMLGAVEVERLASALEEGLEEGSLSGDATEALLQQLEVACAATARTLAIRVAARPVEP